MLWLIIGEQSHEIISTNIHHIAGSDRHQLWATRPGMKSLKLIEGSDLSLISEYKTAIDTAIAIGEKTFDMSKEMSV